MPNGYALLSTSAGDAEKPKQRGNQVTKGPSDEQVADMKILRTLAGYLWMKDNPEFRLRVVAALGLLIGAKASKEVKLQAIPCSS